MTDDSGGAAAGTFETLVFCTSYVRSRGEWSARYARWIAHHRALPFTRPLLCLIDDGSPYVPADGSVRVADAAQPLPDAPAVPLLVRFAGRLGRAAVDDYPGWWRSFLFSEVVARRYGCTRIVHVESDAYVLTRRMVDFISARRNGWTAFWCPRWHFPETGIQVVCADRFDAMRALREAGSAGFAGQYAERVLPFTDVVRDPHGNRYGEFRAKIPGFADFAMQVTPAHKVWFRD
ncbi:MAG TPA: hypothetical protein VFV71_11900 [Burkholderiales bacterium]|nr:hypothetical protein [Burkholderiales bacterium]